jgi:hypothetical protein
MSRVQTLSDFYKSHEWRSLRQSLMIQRSHSAKGLLCEYCKEVILKDIDCIVHQCFSNRNESLSCIIFNLINHPVECKASISIRIAMFTCVIQCIL